MVQIQWLGVSENNSNNSNKILLTDAPCTRTGNFTAYWKWLFYYAYKILKRMDCYDLISSTHNPMYKSCSLIASAISRNCRNFHATGAVWQRLLTFRGLSLVTYFFGSQITKYDVGLIAPVTPDLTIVDVKTVILARTAQRTLHCIGFRPPIFGKGPFYEYQKEKPFLTYLYLDLGLGGSFVPVHPIWHRPWISLLMSITEAVCLSISR